MHKNYFQVLDLDIEFLGFREYLYQILKNNFIHKIGDLISLKFSDVIELDGINERSSNEIMNKVHSFGLCFLDEPNKQKNHEQIKAGIITYNLRKKYYILNFQNKQIEALHTSVEVLDLFPFEYGILKSLKIYTLIDLIKMDKKTIEKNFNRVYKYKAYNSLGDVFVLYNKIVNDVHLLGLTFSDEKVECTSRIFSGEYFR